jgi:hypothetical protein
MSHSHSSRFQEKIQGGEFSFHPFLATWIRTKYGLKEDIILSAQEHSCEESNCPVFETYITIHLDPPLTLKFGREKEKVNKMDFSFSAINCRKT